MAACSRLLVLTFFFLSFCILSSANSSCIVEPGSGNCSMLDDTVCERRLLLSNPPRWNRTVIGNCTSRTSTNTEIIRVSRNEVEIVYTCDTDLCNSEDDWFTKYCPQAFNVKLSWYLQTSSLSFISCTCELCGYSQCFRGKPGTCRSVRNGPKDITRNCLNQHRDYILEIIENSIYESEYKHYDLICNFTDYCNSFSVNEVKEFVCPAMLINELQLPVLQNFQTSAKNVNRQCYSDEWNGPKCSLGGIDGFCFKYLIKFLRRPMLQVYKSEGCDDNIAKKMVVKWECGNPNCMTDYNQAKLFQCFNDIDDLYPTLSLRRGICRCTPEGMDPHLGKFCIDGLCSRDSILQDYEIYSNHSFFCSNFGHDSYGCYFKNSEPFGVLYVDELTYSGNKKARRMLCGISKCNKRISINAIFGCEDRDDELFGPPDDPDKLSTITPRVLSMDPNEILGPVGAVVVIFLTVVIGIIFITNIIVVYNVQKKWRRDDKLKAERDRKRQKKFQESLKTDSGMYTTMCRKQDGKTVSKNLSKSPKSNRDRSGVEMMKSSRDHSLR